jgi:hypothetical protein
MLRLEFVPKIQYSLTSHIQKIQTIFYLDNPNLAIFVTSAPFKENQNYFL